MCPKFATMDSIFGNNLVFNILAVLVTLITLVIVYFKWTFMYWTKTGVPTLNPIMFFGDAKDMITYKTSFGEQYADYYNKFKAAGQKHGGVYLMSIPSYVPVDINIVRNIMQKDFQHFVNHGMYVNEKVDPISGHLFNMEGTKWRNLRAKLTPTFTSSKMRMMFQTLTDCGTELNNIFARYSETPSEPIDIKEYLARFTTDVIGSCAFGLDCNCLRDPDTDFRKYGRKIFENTTWEALRNLMPVILPIDLLRFFNFKQTKKYLESFFMKIVKDTVEYREQNGIYRKDFMHLLLQLKNRGKVSNDEKIVDEDGKTKEVALTINEITAQSYIFYAAGFETSSTASTFALYELAINPEIQEKARQEIITVLEKHQGQLTYEAAMNMKYLERVINESLRKYPPAPVLLRRCNKDYIEPITSVLIKAGVHVGIPVYGIQNDPEYYPNPEKFDPDRFSDENKLTRPNFSWIPFGDGPRICIAARFGMLQTKVALVTLLRQYRVSLNEKTETPLKFDNRSFIISTEGGIWLNIKKIDNKL